MLPLRTAREQQRSLGKSALCTAGPHLFVQSIRDRVAGESGANMVDNHAMEELIAKKN